MDTPDTRFLQAADPALRHGVVVSSIGFRKLVVKLVFVALKKRCHCEERSDVAIPRIFREVRKTEAPSTLAV